MKRWFLLPILALTLPGQNLPTITVTTTVVASVSNLSCTGTPAATNFHTVCTLGSQTVFTADSAVPSVLGTSTTTDFQSGTNHVTIQVTKGNPVPDGWSIAVTNGTNTVSKSGSF